jgi:glycosyltransferase involved in cell wall biosynthesis
VRVVMVSKALAVGAYQRKLEEIARLPGVELTAIVPSEWRDRRGHVRLEHAHISGYEMIAAPLRLNGQYHLHFYPTLGRLLKQLRPDILHMDEEPYNLATWHALRLGEAVGARSLFFTWQNLNRRYPWPFRTFEVANYRRVAYAIAGNRAAVDVLHAKGYDGPVAVIPQFGVDPAIFAPPTGDQGRKTKDRDGFALRPSSFVIGYAGALIAEKGVDLLLRACAGLRDTNWRLAIVGDGPERTQLGALAGTLGIGDRVDFLGQRASTQMPDVYPDFDVLVLPSLSRPNWKEQFGRVLIEAMACGVPVIGSDCGEIPNVIGDAGLTFPEGDSLALRDSIACLLTDSKQRARYAEAGRQRVLAEFTQAQIAAATYRVYREILLQQETT